MFCPNKLYKAPPNTGELILGRTLPSLLAEVCDRHPNAKAFNQWTEEGWQSLSNQDFRNIVEELALGLVNLGLEKGDRIALLMHSDVNFCLADMGCLVANLINVPIDLTQTIENITFILKHSQARAIIVSNLELLYQIVPYLWDTPDLNTVIVAEVPSNWNETRSQLLACDVNRDDEVATHSLHPTEIPASACLCIPMVLCQAHFDQPCPQLPQCVQVFSISEVRAKEEGRRQEAEGRREDEIGVQNLINRTEISPNQLATIIYIPGSTGQLQGVMLTHENLSANALAAFTGIEGLEFGEDGVVLSFLPLTHVFARVLVYGHINYGHSIYFSNPSRVMKHLQDVQPTIFATVPLLLEKIYSKILERGSKRRQKYEGRSQKANFWSVKGFHKIALNWALKLANKYELGKKPGFFSALHLKIADKLVFSHWRSLFGGRLKYLLCGGAALKGEIANLFGAAGISILQGYGLTESSSVICVNRGKFNRAGTVGVPIAGVEMAIADDGEILVKAPYITPGYYKNPDATRVVFNDEGWFHTGDIGEFSPDGFLKITDCKKNLFKLSTGKYVTPQPLENHLKQSSLVEQAIVVGSQRKFCAMLIFPNLENLCTQAQIMDIEGSIEELLKHPKIIALYQTLVDEANQPLPPWSTVKRFKFLTLLPTVANGMLTQTLTVRREKVNEAFATEIDALYGESDGDNWSRQDKNRERRSRRGNKAILSELPVSSYPPVPSSSYSPVAVTTD